MRTGPRYPQWFVALFTWLMIGAIIGALVVGFPEIAYIALLLTPLPVRTARLG